MRQILGVTLALALAAGPAYATVTFAQFKQIDGADTISFTGGNTLSNVTGATVLFDFINPMPPAVDGDITATMIFTATGSPYDGTLQFLRTSDNANLLTVEFTDSILTGGGTSGVFFNSQPGIGTIIYTSDFIDFGEFTAADFALSFSGLSAPFGSGAWTADATGTFAFIPEPATWAMMIAGFGGIGALLRRRSPRSALA